MILAAPLVPLFAQAAGITAGGLGMIGLTKKVSDYIRQNPEESKEIIKLISPGAAGISTLFENKKREEDNNLPSSVEEEKPPQQEPPKDPNILPELLTEAATNEVEKKVKNKIQTWEKYLSPEEAEKAAKEKNLTLKDFEKPALMKQISFKKRDFGDGYDIYFDKKYVGELNDITFLKQEDGSQKGRERTFNLAFINQNGSLGEAFDTIDGIKNAKDQAKSVIADSLLEESDDPDYPTLKQIYENLEYNEKGMPKATAEEMEKNMREIEERENKKAKGGLMDKPLLGRSRDI